jgi:hypothetical protein
MTIVFPRPMPSTGVGSQVFEPQQVAYETAEAGGDSYGIGAGFPRWQAQWSLASGISPRQSDDWRAFLASLKGSMRTFLGRDFERPFPRLYGQGFGGMSRAAGGAFDGSLTTWSQAMTGDGQALLSLTGLPAGFVLSQGDYADFRWLTGGVERRTLVRALVDATADGSGAISAVSVEPPVPTLTPGTAVAHLDNPACVMRLTSSQTQVSDMDRRRVAGATIVALQDLHK